MGKTTVSANLSAALTVLGKTVLVVDGDFQNRCMDIVLGLENMSVYDCMDVLTGRVRAENAIIRLENNRKLSFMPAPAVFPVVTRDGSPAVDSAYKAVTAERVAKVAAEVKAFELELEGLSKFPERGPARVIISRVISWDQRMGRLHRLIDSAVGGMGLAMDTRVLVPHLTLGRVNSNRGMNRLLRLLEKHDLDFFGAFLVERVVVYQSVPANQAEGGRKYVVVCRAELGK